MCRNIKTLFNFEPPATDQEMRAAAIQFVKKVSGTAASSQVNQAAFDKAVNDIEKSVAELLSSLVTTAPAKDRAIEAEKAKARSAKRFGTTK